MTTAQSVAVICAAMCVHCGTGSEAVKLHPPHPSWSHYEGYGDIRYRTWTGNHYTWCSAERVREIAAEQFGLTDRDIERAFAQLYCAAIDKPKAPPESKSG